MRNSYQISYLGSIVVVHRGVGLEPLDFETALYYARFHNVPIRVHVQSGDWKVFKNSTFRVEQYQEWNGEKIESFDFSGVWEEIPIRKMA